MILFVQNHDRVPAANFATWLDQWKVPHATWRPDRDDPLPDLAPLAGVIVLGGYMGVQDQERFPFLGTVRAFMADLLAREVPQLGVCLGGQLLAAVLGGEVRPATDGEHGVRTATLTAAGRRDPLFAGLPEELPVFQWHNDSFSVPSGANHLATSVDCAGQAIRHGNAWGVQFHPEVNGEVVAAWCQQTGAAAEVAESFRRREAELATSARRLLRNFIDLTGR
ncbi:type 1 glutamine amidotransferase [Desulfuromonas carbonis]|uniref:type 1 glutamine amidotransferase n=1 Tax=Desulfuromonas sp. DDH964 TaxID=1823759 RepID=UPI00078CDE7A|nr:type 1 glutamine amidotransferase [Desulfuromonas sp. DDH964]AMV70480.1 glutamine-dependent amidotransferase, class I [Desulfuromonas sp. DDH964]